MTISKTKANHLADWWLDMMATGKDQILIDLFHKSVGRAALSVQELERWVKSRERDEIPSLTP